MQLDAKLSELENRVATLEKKVVTLEGEVLHILPIWRGDQQSPGVPIRLDRIEQRSLSRRESKTLNYTMIGTWATLGTLLLGILALLLDRLLGP